jgi:hypothetical protein
VVADLRQFLLPGFFAFGEVFVISFRLLKSIFSLLIGPVFAGGASCLLVLNIVFTLLIGPVFAGGAGCLLVLNNVFTLLIGPVFADGAGCLLVLNNVDFLFRWLVAAPRSACKSVLMRHSSHPCPARNLTITIVVLVSRTGLLGVLCGALPPRRRLAPRG